MPLAKQLETKTLAVAFADLAGYTALTEAHGDLDAAGVAARFYELASQSLVDDVRLVKPIGDAVMLAGPDPIAAARSLIALGAALDAEPRYPSMRAGLHYGPVVERDGDLFGATVNVAARLAAHARAGQLLCTAAVRDALTADTSVRVLSLGSVKLKNVQKAIDLFEIATGPASQDLVLDPVCRMRVDRRSCRFTLEREGSLFWFCSESCRARYIQDRGKC